MATTIVGAVKYDASIDLASLKSSVAQADKIVEQSYKKQSRNAQKTSKEITSTSSKDAQARVDAVTKEAQATVKTISSYAPQVQKQFLTVERANNQVANATIAAQKAIQNYGTESVQASKATNILKVAIQNQAQQQDKLNSMLDGSYAKTGRFSSAMKTAGVVAGATAAVVGTVLNKAINAITSSIGSAVSRVDTLNNAPKVLKNLGYSAVASAKATQKLAAGIQGLPTSLNDAVTALLSIASASGKSIDYATDLTLAFNNMALAGGKGAVDASRALLQFTQALGRGSFQANDFNTLMEVMPAQLNQVAKTLLGPSANAQTLKSAFSNGKVSVDQFSDAVIDLNKKGGKNFASFTNQAKDATSGIGTGFSNMQTAISRGLAKIIQTIGAGNISGAINGVGKAFEVSLNAIAATIGFVEGHSKAFQTLAIIIGSILTPAILSYTVATIAAGVQSLLAGARMAAGWLLALGPIGLIVAAVVAATALIIANWSNVSKFVYGVWVNIARWGSEAWENIKRVFGGVAGWFKNIFTGAWTGIKSAFSGVGSFFKGIWNTITGIFGKIGTTVGHAIGGGFKAVINSVLSHAQNVLNAPINAINSMIGKVDSILPGNQSNWKINTFSLPRLAEGAIVQARPGGILANIGEGGEDEAVIPLSKLEKIMNGGATNSQNITVNLTMSGVMTSSKSDERAIATRMAKLINETVKAKTGNPAIAGV